MASSGGELHVMVVEGSMEAGIGSGGDKYVIIRLGEQSVSTRAVRSDPLLKWQQGFCLALTAGVTTLTVSIGGTDSGILGEAQFDLPTALCEKGGTKAEWYELRNPAGSPVARLCLVLRFVKTSASDGSQRPVRSATLNAQTRTRSAALPAASAPLPGPAGAPSFATSPAPSAASAAPAGSARPTTSSAAKGKPSALAPSRPPISTAGSTNRALVPSKRPSEGKGQPGPQKGSAGQRVLLLSGGLLLVALASMLLGDRQRKPQVYEVKKGDTVCSIAGCYGLSPDDVVDANLAIADDPDRIFPGDRLFIP